MTVNDTPQPQGAVATPSRSAQRPAQRSVFARSALIAGGATAGLAASAIAGFGLVGLMFPNAGLPGTGGAPLTAAAYMPVTETAIPEIRLARLEPAPVPPVAPALPARPLAAYAPDAAGTATPTAPALVKPQSLTASRTPETTGAVAAPDAIVAAPAPGETPAAIPGPVSVPVTDPVVASKSVEPDAPGLPAADTSGTGPRMAAAAPDVTGDESGADLAPNTASFGPRIAMLPPETRTPEDLVPDVSAPEVSAPAATVPTVRPEHLAALADDDAAARASSGLFAEPAAVAPEVAAAPQAEVSPLRPARRPEGFADQLATMDVPAPSAAPATSIRPAPRPEIRRVAAVTPAPAPTAALAAAPAAAPAEIAAPAKIVEVAARRGSGGFLSGGSSSCGRSLARAMPARRGGAAGSAFFTGLANVSGPDRDARAIAELARGNMPGFLHNLQPVTFRGQDARGAQVEITICVTPDYLALGSDKDYVRVPLGLPAAARIAGAFNMTLPTPRMVDAIYAQAKVKLSPAPMAPGAQMSSTPYFVAHNATIEKQLQGRRGLVAGHKKDVVMASRMASAPGRVAIYGWHRRGGAPIQPVSTVHGANYADYSHGIRLVSKTAYLNGKAVSLDDLLASSRYAHLLNTDGPMPGPVIRVASN